MSKKIKNSKKIMKDIVDIRFENRSESIWGRKVSNKFSQKDIKDLKVFIKTLEQYEESLQESEKSIGQYIKKTEKQLIKGIYTESPKQA